MRICTAIAALATIAGLASAQSSPFIDIPKFTRSFNSLLSRGWQGQVPCNVTVVGVNVPNEELLGLQNVAVFRMSAKPSAYPASTTETPAWGVTLAPTSAVVPVTPAVKLKQGDWLGVIGTCSSGPAVLQSNSYGTAGPFASQLGGQATTLYRLITQSTISTLSTMPYGPVALSSEDTGNLSRVEVYVVALGGDNAAPKPGTTVNLTCEAGLDAGLTYVLALSLSGGPIAIGQRQIELGADSLLLLTVQNLIPTILVNAQGTLDGDGLGKAKFNVPNLPILVGTKVHSAFVTLDALAPDGVRSISQSFIMKIS